MTLIFAISLLIAAVWGVLLIWHGSLLSACLLLFVVIASVSHPFLSVQLGPMAWTADRLALLVVFAMCVVHRWLGRTESRSFRATDYLLLGFVAFLAASTVYGFLDPYPFGTESPVWRLIAGYLVPLAFYLLARQAPLTDRELRIVHVGIIVFGVYLAVTGFMEVHQQWSLVFPRYIADRTLGLHFGRARGPMLHSVSYGMCVSAAVMAAWLLLPQLSPRGRVIVGCALPLLLLGAWYSYTRSVWIGLGTGMLLILAFQAQGAWRVLLLVGVLLAGSFAMLGDAEQIVTLQRESSATESRDSAFTRLNFAWVSWCMFLDRPILGVGFGQFPGAKLPYLSDRTLALPLEAIRENVHHNSFLSLLTETGIIGLMLFLAVLAGFSIQAVRLWRNEQASAVARYHGLLMLGFVPLYAAQLLFHELSYGSIYNSLVFFMAGISSGLQQAQPVTLPELQPARSTRPTLRVVHPMA